MRQPSLRFLLLRWLVPAMLVLLLAGAATAYWVALRSATDITGYGLLGHADELARNSGVGLRILAARVPLLPGALGYAQQGILPGGLGRNRSYLEAERAVRISADVGAALAQLLYDPQTSGGLLFAVPRAQAGALGERFAAAEEPIWEIGEVIAGGGIEVE